ncbi:MAG: sigma 54-interacting transcriptional regulator [Gemmatimonadetes bacterium]|nr:sigma 54-interacting transcriptional regulator [Gemmatimonadota bacterium]NNM06126.1 sigma 54-interacting transcriptional regulator [Gemmatimonadota bacterium]
MAKAKKSPDRATKTQKPPADPPSSSVPDPAELAVLADVADLAFFQVDENRDIVSVSPALERLTGFKAEEVLGRSCLTMIRCKECLQGCGVFQDKEVKDVPLTLYRADGSTLDVLKSGRAFVEGNRVKGAVETVQPVGEARPAASGPPRELDTLLGALGRYFIIADGNMRVVGFSGALPEWLGIEPDALYAKPVSELLGLELFGEESEFRRAVLDGERREGWRATVHGPEGTTHTVSISVGPISESSHCGASGARLSMMLRVEEEPEEQNQNSFQGILARSSSMRRIFRLIDLLRDNDSTVLVTGESGTGKELVARAVHDTSHRKAGPFVAVNCAALPSELMESDLFGHVRGAFTGAVRDKPGRFEIADGGTLFLDEIGDLALPLQAKLLRALQEHEFERVGDTKTRKVDVRVIAATGVDLGQAVSKREFREDLYYRLRVVPIEVPPLRERREDLDLLIRHLLDQIGKARGRALRLAPGAMRALLAYRWPGNVRELENALEYATTVCEGQTIHVGDLPVELGPGNGEELVSTENAVHPPSEPSDEAQGRRMPTPRPEDPPPPATRGLEFSPSEAEEMARIRKALERTRYRRGEAADLLGMSRSTLWRKMKEYRM